MGVRVAPRIKVNDATRVRDIRRADIVTNVLAVFGIQRGQPNGDVRRHVEIDVEVDLSAFLTNGGLLRCPRPRWTLGGGTNPIESDSPGGKRDA